MLIPKREIEQLSCEVKHIIDGHDVDLRDNKESALSVLRNDIHVLARMKENRACALEEDYGALKDTLADISHQLKTPLTSAMIMTDLLESTPAEKQAELVHNINSSLQRIDWLTTTLLNVARLEAGAIELKPELTAAYELVQRALLPLKIQLELKNLEVTILDDIFLCCDIFWTVEALINLIKNAIEHAPEGSTIHIESGGNPLYAWISVKNEGTGMTRAQVAHVFNYFERSKSSTGYGIGLPFALKIMREQDGDIEIQNGDKGCGTAVTLKFYKNKAAKVSC